MKLRKLFQAVAGAAFLFSTGACSPMQQVYNKEKQTIKTTESNRETQAAVRPGEHADHFIVGTAIGKMDFLFVVDNSASTGHRIHGNDSALDYFRNSYARFLNEKLKSEPAKKLDYRVQLVTTPEGKLPENFISHVSPTDLHLDEIFLKQEDPNPYLFSRTDAGRESDALKKPFTSTQLGLAHAAFTGRSHIPIFIVYLLGSDSEDASKDPAEQDAAFQKALKENNRDLFQTRILVLSSKTSDRLDPEYCERYRFPATVLKKLEAVLPLIDVNRQPMSILTRKNICEKSWRNFEDDLFDSMIQLKKSFVLSRKPHLPERMVVNIPNHLYRYGDDFLFNAQTNEVLFLPGRGPEAGDLLSVSYFLEPNEELLPGGKSPNPPNPDH